MFFDTNYLDIQAIFHISMVYCIISFNIIYIN